VAKKNYIIDTSVFLSDAQCIYKLGNADIFIPLKVLEEIDKHKKRQDSVGFNARQIIKILDSYRAKGSLTKGVRIGKGKGIIKICEPAGFLPDSLNKNIADHVILSSALGIKNNFPNRKSIVLSRDINMRVIADAIDIESDDHIVSQVIDDTNKIYTGFAEVLVDDQLIDQFYAGEDIFLDETFFSDQKMNAHLNQFLILVSSANPKKTALCRFNGYNIAIKPITSKYRDLSWGITPRNKEQSFAYDLLFDDDIPLVSLIGRAGSGKTLIAIAAGLEQTLGLQERKYKKIVVSRPIQPLGKDIGFLPGSMHEKMLPWLMPIQDNMQFILGNDRTMLTSYLESGEIEIEALTYIRGRSISNAFIIIDEAQNLTAHEVKTIITRVGEGTKIVLTGDIEQIDNIYTNETSNGLTYAIEKFKHSEISGHMTFKKGERSKIATLASKIL
jgi:PhoH-like ATPase